MHVVRHQSERARWEMVSRDAPPRLRGYVRNYTGYSERTADPLRRREVPSADVTMILSPGPALSLPDPVHPERPAARPVSFVAGLHDRAALVGHDGEQQGVEVRLTPIGAHLLFGLPMHELTNRAVGVDDLLGTGAADELIGRLWDAPAWERRFDFLDSVLAARLAEARAPQPELTWAWGRLRATHGRVGVRGLAQELGWSHRRLIERFRMSVGMPPKALARILRFDRVAERLRATTEPRLAEVAYDCGYYDQAHLNRDFREFAGTTPTAYLARRLPDHGGVTV
jgi:AraC-like DNA-binding protein